MVQYRAAVKARQDAHAAAQNTYKAAIAAAKTAADKKAAHAALKAALAALPTLPAKPVKPTK